MNILQNSPPPVKLALRPREAAEALGISERTLFSMTKAGEIPHVKRQKMVLYPVAELQQWLSEQVSKPDREGGAA